MHASIRGGKSARLLFSILSLVLCLGLLAGCQETGAKKTLSDAAKALTEKNSQAFLGLIDMDAFASHELVNLKENNSFLSFAGEVGSLFGVGNEMDEWLKGAMNLKDQYTRTFTRTVGTGELVNQCTTAKTPDCPWDPDGLKKAEVKEIGTNAAVARVTTKANMTSWVALQKQGEKWVIVGKAILEDQATKFATNERPILSAIPNEKEAPKAKPAPAPAPETSPSPAPGDENRPEAI